MPLALPADPEVAYALNKMQSPKIVAPILFTVAVGVGSFGAAHYFRLHRPRVQAWWKELKKTWIPSWIAGGTGSAASVRILGPDGSTLADPPARSLLRCSLLTDLIH